MIRKEDVFKIGILGKPHGINGEIGMTFTDDVFDRTDADYLILLIDGIMIPFFIEEYRFRSAETIIIKFCDIDNSEKAREFTGTEIYFPKSLSDGQEDDIVTWDDIIGYTIKNDPDDSIIGTISAVDDSTANVLFSVKTTDGKDVLIPASEELITTVDQDYKIIKITIPEGLLDI
jgi:16S rRNA processing protein RimM